MTDKQLIISKMPLFDYYTTQSLSSYYSIQNLLWTLHWVQIMDLCRRCTFLFLLGVLKVSNKNKAEISFVSHTTFGCFLSYYMFHVMYANFTTSYKFMRVKSTRSTLQESLLNPTRWKSVTKVNAALISWRKTKTHCIGL